MTSAVGAHEDTIAECCGKKYLVVEWMNENTADRVGSGKPAAESPACAAGGTLIHPSAVRSGVEDVSVVIVNCDGPDEDVLRKESVRRMRPAPATVSGLVQEEGIRSGIEDVRIDGIHRHAPYGRAGRNSPAACLPVEAPLQ